MALFSRRKNSDPAQSGPALDAAESESNLESVTENSGQVAEIASEAAGENATPHVSITVDAYRGIGAKSGALAAGTLDSVLTPQSQSQSQSVDTENGPANPLLNSSFALSSIIADSQPVPVDRVLPLAPLTPPPPADSMPGMPENVLLRAALRQLDATPTPAQMLGVMRQMLQGQLYLRVQPPAPGQPATAPISVGVIQEGDRKFLLAFTGLETLRESVQRESYPTATAAAAQPVLEVLKHVIAGGFAGLILDNADTVHRAVFTVDVLKQALDHADPKAAIKTILTQPHTPETVIQIAQVLSTTGAWVAVGVGKEGEATGIAEARLPDGRRFLQIFSHPLEVVALQRPERPLPFTPDRLAAVLRANPALAGVLVDFAGPGILVSREELLAQLEKSPGKSDG